MSLNINRVQALCFDIDGSLSDTDDQFVLRLSKLLRPVRYLFSQNDPVLVARRLVMATESPGNYLYGLSDRLGIDNIISNFGDIVYRLGIGSASEPFIIIPGVKDMLIKLYRRFPLSVVSSRGRRSTNRFIEQFELKSFFQCIATAQTCAHKKPYPDQIIWAAKQMNVEPKHCLMIGDTVVDILAAKAAGSQSVGVLCGFGEEDELRQAGSDLIINRTDQLTEALGVFQAERDFQRKK
ncbi:MAG: HAD family hydrolase [Anaerolineales bacterium]|jgi:phosphoglycolate phosphatase-like HAD superfamily hydrolase